MKVSELIKALERYPDNEAVIPVKLPHSSIGGSPTVPIKGAFSGFDWDRGKLLIQRSFNARSAPSSMTETSRSPRRT